MLSIERNFFYLRKYRNVRFCFCLRASLRYHISLRQYTLRTPQSILTVSASKNSNATGSNRHESVFSGPEQKVSFCLDPVPFSKWFKGGPLRDGLHKLRVNASNSANWFVNVIYKQVPCCELGWGSWKERIGNLELFCFRWKFSWLWGSNGNKKAAFQTKFTCLWRRSQYRISQQLNSLSTQIFGIFRKIAIYSDGSHLRIYKKYEI